MINADRRSARSTRRSRRAARKGGIALALAAALVVTFSPVAVAAPTDPPTDPAPQQTAPSSGTEVGESSELAAALATARATGKQVEVISKRTTTSSTFANPDGTLSDQVTAAPTRAVATDGTLVPVDTTLTRVGDRLQGKATNAKVSLRSLASDLTSVLDVATLDLGAKKSISLGFGSVLPAATIDGATATYPLSPTSHLAATALDRGFGVDVILDKAPALQPTYTFPIQTSGGVTPKLTNGVLAFVTGDGTVVAQSRPLVMWDSHRDEAGDPDRVEPLKTSLTQVGPAWLLSITPAMDYLTSPSTQYPVTVDPTIVIAGGTGDLGDTWYYKDNTTNNVNNYALSIGRNGSPAHSDRAYLSWNTAKIIGRVVTDASLSLYQYTAGSCDPKEVKVSPTHSVAAVDMDDVTTNDSAAWVQSTSFNTGQCGLPNAYQTMDVTNVVNGWATGELANYAMELRAGNETDTTQYKRTCSEDPAPAGTNHCEGTTGVPKLSITYMYDLGKQPGDQFIDHAQNDRSQFSINAQNGNLVLDASDLRMNGRNLDLNVDRFYNSLATTDGAFGQGWAASLGQDVKLKRISDDRWTYIAPGGTWYGNFVRYNTDANNDLWEPAGNLTSSDFYAPSFGGVNARLKDNGSGQFTLTFNQSQEKYVFSDLNCGSCDKVLKEIKDRNDNKIVFTYNNTTRKLTSIKDTHLRDINISYGSNGYISSITEATTVTPTPRVWTYHYNASNQLDYYIDATGKQTDYGYANGLLTTITDPAQNDGKRPKTTFTYSNSQVTSVSYSINATTGVKKFTYVYSTNTANAQAACEASTIDWTTFTTVTNVNDPQGGATKYCYRDRTRDPSVTNPGEDNEYSQKTRVVDGNGKRRSTSFTPNMAAGAGTTQSNESGGADGTTAFKYNTNNNLAQTTQPKDGSTTTAGSTFYDYPASGQNDPINAQSFLPTSTKSSGGSCTSSAYDPQGNLTDTYSGIAATGTSCAGATSGKRNHVKYNTDGTPEEAYSPVASTLSTITPADKTLYTYWDTEPNMGELKKVVRPGGNSTCTTNRTGCTTFVYDEYSRVTQTTDGNNNTTSYTYDKNDRVTRVLTGGATSCTYSAGTCVTYAFDAEGNLTSRIDKSGTTSYTYDWMNNQISQTQPSGTVLNMTYDGAGNLTQYKQTLSGQTADTVNYTYDAANNLSTISDVTGTYNYTYNDDARPTNITLPTTPATSLTYAYRKNGKVKTIGTTGGSSLPGPTAYNYDNSDNEETNQLRKTTLGSLTTTYDYDSDDRIDAVTPSSGASYAYDYDTNGNVTRNRSGATTTYYGYNRNNQLCWSGATNGTQMAQSCPSTPSGGTTYTSDGAGNNLGTTAGPLVYNASNQVTSISSPGGSGPVTQTYSDQGNNIRLSHGNDNFTTGGPLGVTAKKNGTAITYWTRDPDGQIINTHGASGTYFYQLDRLGSTMALIATDGTKAGGYTYDPYGKTTAVTGTSTTAAQNNPWRYIGGYQNPTDGFYKFGARYYDSAGHFNQQDPVPGSIGRPEKFNSFTYTAGDPVNQTDLAGTNLAGDFGSNAGALAASVGVGITFCTIGIVACVVAGAVAGAALSSAGAYLGTKAGGGTEAEANGAAGNSFITGAVFGAIGGPVSNYAIRGARAARGGSSGG